MEETATRAIAIVGLGAILPNALYAPDFWRNICDKRYSITEVPPDRWSIANYYDPDPKAPDKTYSKIGGWVQGFTFDWKQYHVPPRVVAAMDQSQQWAVSISAQALADFGYPQRPLDLERTGVVMGTAMGGELHYLTYLRISFPEFAQALESVSEFSQLPAEVRQAILEHWQARVKEALPPVTEDSMPGELANIVSGRVANLLNLRGPNFITDAACASSFAAILASIELLEKRHCDAVIAGGVDRNMGASTFVKFCKIGALSATGTRPFGDGADGFVMGEGAAAFLLKRLVDAERDGDHIYAVIRGVGGSSDGRGKGITAPNPLGQRLAIQRAWENAGLDPATATFVEAHGTSTRVGDVAEVESLSAVFNAAPRQSIALGSVKSNLGHLKGGAGAAGLLKTTLAICHKMLPPTLHAERPNPNIDFAGLPFYLNTELHDWPQPANGPRRAGVSAYGFGGTNFHVVLEEHVPGMLTAERLFQAATVQNQQAEQPSHVATQPVSVSVPVQPPNQKPPLRGLLALGAESRIGLQARLAEAIRQAADGGAPAPQPPEPADLQAAERLVIDFGDPAELLERLQKAEKALATDQPAAWKALQAQGVFRGSGPQPGKIAFLFPGQGSQYLNMGRDLAAREPVVAQVFAEADQVMTPILGKPLSTFIYADSQDAEAVKLAEQGLMQTAITQPAMLTMDTAIYRLLGEYGFAPDMVMGHSLGEYAALIAAGVLPLADGLEATAARGREMTRVSMDDNGWMAAVMAPLDVVEKTLAEVDGYVVAANINSRAQCVIGGASQAVARAIELFQERGYQAQRIPVSHAFHTKIVAPASQPLRAVLDRLHVSTARLPVIANVSGDFYPADVEAIKDSLEKQVASPVQWVKGLETLYAAGVRTFVEVGPKKALKGFTDDVFADKPDVVSLYTNHPKTGEIVAFNQALCGLYAAGYGVVSATETVPAQVEAEPVRVLAGKDQQAAVSATGAGGMGKGSVTMEKTAGTGVETVTAQGSAGQSGVEAGRVTAKGPEGAPPLNGQSNGQGALAQMLAQALLQLVGQPAGGAVQQAPEPAGQPVAKPDDRNATPVGSVIISGTGLGLPGAEKPVMDPDNAMRILRGEQFVDLVPERFRKKVLAKQITRVVKAEDGSGSFETVTSPDDVIRLAGRPGPFDLTEEYGVPAKLVEALDITTQLAMAAGLDALREAGIPLVQTWKRTSTGKYLPDRWLLPEALRDETGVIFASAFPGGDRFAGELESYFTWQNRLDQIDMLENLRQFTNDPATLGEIQRRVNELRAAVEREPYVFDRRFLFRVLSMGHSQLAEYIGARGPNTQVNAACASTAQAVALAEDWIRGGRCRRVLVVGADDVTGDHLMEWIAAGFVSTGAAATDDRVEEAALPFDRRRHGTIMGMGACALLVESEDAVRERGMRGIVELLSSETANSAYHGTRLDIEHIAMVMNQVVTSAELRFGLNRLDMAGETVFMSHETFTPARGGSASAEVAALRQTFGDAAGEIVVANTKGFTGHPMGVGVEDVIAVKILEYGIVPPVPNFQEVDPDLGRLNLSRGGRYPVRYALHLAAGFGSQIAMTLVRRIPGALDRIDNQPLYRRWLADASGQDQAETEVVKRVLRIKAEAAPKRQPVASTWRYGTGPAERTVAYGSDHRVTWPAAVPLPSFQAPAPAGHNGQNRETPQASQAVAPPASPPEAPAQAESAAPALVEPAAPPKPQAETAQPAAQAPAQDLVVEQVLAIVAEKTGYPRDMLDMDLDLEADLGVDTVKQAETFAAIREAFAIPRQENLKLRDYPTLTHVIRFVHDMRPDLAVAAPGTGGGQVPVGAGVAAVTAVPASEAPVATATDPVAPRVLAIVAEKTGYPQEMLDLDLDLEADLGVDTVKQAETFAAIRQAFDIPRQENLKLRDYPTLSHVIRFVHDMRPDLGRGEQGTRGKEVPVGAGVAVGAAAPAPESLAVTASDPAAEQVLAIVAEKTGYPQDMLDLDLDLEADLGVDTVKQAETFAAIRQAFDIPRQENLKLRDYPTLTHVIRFVHDMRPDLAVAAPGTGGGERVMVAAGAQVETGAAQVLTVAPPAVPSPDAVPQVASLESADLIPRRVPVPVLRPPLDLCKETGVRLAQDSRVVVMLDEGGAGKELVARLEARGATVLTLEAPLTAAAIEKQAGDWLAAGPIQGVYWLPALDVEPELEALDLAGWRAANQSRTKNLYTLMRTLYGAVTGANTFLVSATHLGGLHGYGPQGATAPLGGAVAGFTKAYKRERPETLVKVVDFGEGLTGAADALLAETLFDPGVVEVGYHKGFRYTVSLEEQPAADGQPGLVLGKETVFLVTGAAGGITSAIVADLAAASGGIFYLLDLAEAPARNDSLVALFRSDKEALKQCLIETMKAAGERPTPAKVDRQILAVERSEAALRAIEAVEAAGGTAYYHSLNLLDGPAVAAVLDDVRQRHGRIDVLLHAGGVEISRSLPDKEPKQFDLVFDVKAEGFYNLLHAVQGLPIGATVAFSSVAGRFGNAGQTDYSAANDLLCKITSSLRRWRPETRGIVIDWTAWGGIGMATRGSIPKIMEMAGIDMLPPESGVPTIRRELTRGARRGELVVGGRLGILASEWDADGGLDPAKATERARTIPLPMLGQVKAVWLNPQGPSGLGGLEVETELDPKAQPFLHDHQFEGNPLLPGVMGVESFAELASLLVPDYRVLAVENVQFTSPFKFYRHQPRTLHLNATVRPAADGQLLAHTVLSSRTQPAGGKEVVEPQVKVHFTAEVRLGCQPPTTPAIDFTPPAADALTIGAGEIYKIYFHGPAYKVVERAGVEGQQVTGLLAENLPPDTAEGSGRWLMAPRLIEFCFQTAGLWQIATQQVLALPMTVGSVTTYRRLEDAGGSRLYARVSALNDGTAFDAQVVDEAGNVYVDLHGYRTVQLPGTVRLE